MSGDPIMDANMESPLSDVDTAREADQEARLTKLENFLAQYGTTEELWMRVTQLETFKTDVINLLIAVDKTLENQQALNEGLVYSVDTIDNSVAAAFEQQSATNQRIERTLASLTTLVDATIDDIEDLMGDDTDEMSEDIYEPSAVNFAHHVSIMFPARPRKGSFEDYRLIEQWLGEAVDDLLELQKITTDEHDAVRQFLLGNHLNGETLKTHLGPVPESYMALVDQWWGGVDIRAVHVSDIPGQAAGQIACHVILHIATVMTSEAVLIAVRANAR
jgi:hypothetical protein